MPTVATAARFLLHLPRIAVTKAWKALRAGLADTAREQREAAPSGPA
ncbi:hypothetical protein [Azospirillum sp. B4]|nr:hypothetical protein [Azospirillum sp. B4]